MHGTSADIQQINDRFKPKAVVKKKAPAKKRAAKK